MNNLVTFLGIFVLVINLLLILHILFVNKKSPQSTLAWILVLHFLPWLGFCVYLFFGINWRGQRVLKHLADSDKNILHPHVPKNLSKELIDLNLPVKQSLFNIALTTTGLPPTLNNEVIYFDDMQTAFSNKILDILSAKNHIHLEYYTFYNDDVGKKLKDALLQKANEGIKIKIIFDYLGSYTAFRTSFFKKMTEHKNIEVFPFEPLRFPQINLKANFRNHRKILIIDNEIAYLGGMNIGKEYLEKSSRFNYWRDSVIKIKGEAVNQIQDVFKYDWHFVSNEKINTIDSPTIPKITKTTPIQIIPSAPDSEWDTITQMFFESIATAEKSIYINTPYLIPDETLIMSLKTATTGGCNVKIIIPGCGDHFVTYYASLAYAEELIKNGIEVYLYNPSDFIHSKVIIIDSNIASIGSANFDQRSMNINFEITAFLYDKKIASIMEKSFFNDLKKTQKLSLDYFKKLSIHKKIFMAICRLFAPMI